MEKEKKLLLPQLKVDESITESQCWKMVNDPYSYLIQNLKLSYESVNSIFDGKSSAMPHIFEQMLLFERAFWNERDPDHLRAVLEWRAVLAIMALPRLCNLRLVLNKVDFLTPASPFLSAAAGFRPKNPPVFDQTTWDFLYVLRLNGTAIALFSPTTLVCPAKQFKQRLDDLQRIGDLDWLKIEKINDKEQLTLDFRGKEAQRRSLADWLDELCGSLAPAAQVPELMEKTDRVKKELTSFSKELAPDKRTATPLYYNFYPSINRSRRREYSFLNNCCNFNIIDPNMEFLVERYQQDIFQSNLMVVVYDRTVDSMNRESHIPLLDRLFSNVFQLKGQPITSICMEGGERVAAYALLPFKQSFVEELIQHRLTPETVIEEYSVIYRKDLDAAEITLQICGFPYAFCKRFPRANWKLIYGTELASVRLWPSENLKKNAWNNYYVHTSEPYTQGARWEVPLAKSVNTLSPSKGTGAGFQISRCQFFPSFLCCVCNSDIGYLPIYAQGQGKGQVGGVALILLDVGHTTTAIKLLQFSNTGSYPPKALHFWAPRAVCIAGAAEEQAENFISAQQTPHLAAISSFKNIIKTFRDYDVHKQGAGIRPFEDGVVLFDLPNNLTGLRSQAISFLNFEYIHMNQEDRRNAHTFIEQLMIYAAHTAALYQCSYLQVGFLHSYPENDHRVGELEQIFRNVLDQAAAWSGLKKSLESPVHYMRESEALIYRLYWEIIKNQGDQKDAEKEAQHYINAAMDIGWQKTTLASILNMEDKPEAKYTQINFAGKDISMLDGAERLHCYPEMLNILLCGRHTVDPNGPDGTILEEFRQYCTNIGTGVHTFYQGIFDVIAQKIDDAGFIIPPDVYNRMDEFRAVLQMLTYNILLLFFNAGYMLGRFYKDRDAQNKHIRLYLSGNGAKFLNWICNLKNPDCIDASNVNKMFILKLSHTIIDAILYGFAISSKQKVEELNASIYLLKDGKEQLLNGFALKEQPQLFDLRHIPPDFEVTPMDNVFLEDTKAHKSEFYARISDLRQSVFGASVHGTSGHHSGSNLLDEIISIEGRSVCDTIIKKINKM